MTALIPPECKKCKRQMRKVTVCGLKPEDEKQITFRIYYCPECKKAHAEYLWERK